MNDGKAIMVLFFFVDGVSYSFLQLQARDAIRASMAAKQRARDERGDYSAFLQKTATVPFHNFRVVFYLFCIKAVKDIKVQPKKTSVHSKPQIKVPQVGVTRPPFPPYTQRPSAY